MNTVLEKIRDFADQAHGDQKRKYSEDRYIVHPIRVMNICEAYINAQPVLAAALLHDVLEDTPVNEEEMLAFLESVLPQIEARQTLSLVIELTDVFVKKNYPDLNRKTRKQKEAERLSKTSFEAQTIKYADILDNTDVTMNDPDFARVFLREGRQLLLKMKDGDSELRARTIKRVEECIRQLGKKSPQVGA